MAVRYIVYSLLLLFAGCSATIAFYAPVRVLFPGAFGVACEHGVCVDDPGRRSHAVALYDAATNNLKVQQGLLIGEPKIVFCSTEECRDAFGLGKRAGYTLGTFGIAIAPRGWKRYYVAHELVHYWQAETFGSLALLSGESWLIEGMAYALSDDPRSELSEPFETYRREFLHWYDQQTDTPLEVSVGQALENGS